MFFFFFFCFVSCFSCLFPAPVLIRLNNLDLGKQSRGDNKKISEYFKGHPPSSPGRQSGTKSPSPVQQQQQQQPIQPQSFLGVPSPCPSPQGAATTTVTTAAAAAGVATSSSYPNSNMNHSAPAGAFSLLYHLIPLLSNYLSSYSFKHYIYSRYRSSRTIITCIHVAVYSLCYRWHSSQQYGHRERHDGHARVRAPTVCRSDGHRCRDAADDDSSPADRHCWSACDGHCSRI